MVRKSACGGLYGRLRAYIDACIVGVFPELGTHLDKLEIAVFPVRMILFPVRPHLIGGQLWPKH